VRGGLLKGLEGLLRIALMGWAIVHFDAFILTFGTGFLAGQRDIQILRRMGKTVIAVYFGSDTRPPYLSPKDGASAANADGAQLARAVLRKKALAARAERWADAVVCHPPSGQFFRRPIVGFLEIGIPTAIRPYVPLDATGDRPIRILHAPSDPTAKGTDRIRAAFEAARVDGPPLEWIELSGVPNDVVLAEIERCDFVVDQAYSDSPLPGLAAEAASRGRPTIVGGWDWPEVERLIGPDCIPPSIRCGPDDLAEAIGRLAQDDALRMRTGESARRFVEGHWQPAHVAQRYLRLIGGDIPEEWRHDPEDIRYAHGWGLDRPRLEAAIRAVIIECGPSGLGVSDKPRLQERLIMLADR
jgi:hypothetical protein